MRATLRITVAALLAVGTWLGLARGAAVAHAGGSIIRVVRYGEPVAMMAPGTPFTALVNGLGGPRSRYCLGLASLRDHYSLPVSLGVFQPGDDGLMMVQARVPARLFPAEPPGPFLLFAGRCTNVAPDGILAAATVVIVPAVG